MNPVLKHLPNVLTGLRLVSAPAVAMLMMGGRDGAALGIFAFAGLSDAADGFLAKRFGYASRFGRFLDPAADKLLMLASFLTLTTLGVAPLWLTAIVIARDAAIVSGVIVVIALNLPVAIAPLFVGRISTACQIAYVALALVLLTAGLRWPEVLQAAAAVTALATLASWAGYAHLLLRALSERACSRR